MRQLSRSVGAVAAACLAISCAGLTHRVKGDAPQTQTPPARALTTADPAVLQDFQARVGKYLELHKEAVQKSTEPKESSNTAKIQAARDTLAATIQAMRKDARQGDVFAPDIAAMFRRFLAPEFKGSTGARTKEEMKEDAPSGILLKVNATYPEKAPLTTMPSNVLLSLPPLPTDLEYRVIGRSLILRDVDANLIVDFIPNAIRTAIPADKS